MNDTERINATIKAIRQKRDVINAQEIQKRNSINNANQKAIEQIRSFVSDFKELIAIADEMTNNGFPLGEKSGLDSSPRFVTNWWSHRIGFYAIENPSSYNVNQLYHIQGFGIMNGGCYGDIDLLINADGTILSKGQVYKDGRMVDIISFAQGFETFKEEFLTYVKKTF